MRFDCSASVYKHLLFVYGKLFTRMRLLIAEHKSNLSRIQKMNMGMFNAGHALHELTTKINEKQLVDKVERMIKRRKPYNAGFAFFCEAWYNFFMFTPFFVLKNIDNCIHGEAIQNLPYNIGFESWDPDIKDMWIEVARVKNINETMISELNDLNYKILRECKP